jgi:hypothetical protein
MKSTINAESAQVLALQALSFLAGDGEKLDKFLLTTGLDPAHLRQVAGDIGFQAGVLDFLLTHEDLLLDFAASENLRPEDVAAARSRLPGATYAS